MTTPYVSSVSCSRLPFNRFNRRRRNRRRRNLCSVLIGFSFISMTTTFTLVVVHSFTLMFSHVSEHIYKKLSFR